MSTIFLDMDGVIADFFTALAKRNGVNHWKSIKDKEKALCDIRNTDFFNEIPMFWDGRECRTYSVFNGVKRRSIDAGMGLGICSSPLRGDMYNSAYWKRVWLERNSMMPEVENCIFTGNKHKYAICQLTGRSNILIDDKVSNILDWEKAGGIGIRFQNNEDDIEEYLFPALDEAIKKVNAR